MVNYQKKYLKYKKKYLEAKKMYGGDNNYQEVEVAVKLLVDENTDLGENTDLEVAVKLLALELDENFKNTNIKNIKLANLNQLNYMKKSVYNQITENNNTIKKPMTDNAKKNAIRDNKRALIEFNKINKAIEEIEKAEAQAKADAEAAEAAAEAAEAATLAADAKAAEAATLAAADAKAAADEHAAAYAKAEAEAEAAKTDRRENLMKSKRYLKERRDNVQYRSPAQSNKTLDELKKEAIRDLNFLITRKYANSSRGTDSKDLKMYKKELMGKSYKDMWSDWNEFLEKMGFYDKEKNLRQDRDGLLAISVQKNEESENSKNFKKAEEWIRLDSLVTEIETMENDTANKLSKEIDEANKLPEEIDEANKLPEKIDEANKLLANTEVSKEELEDKVNELEKMLNQMKQERQRRLEEANVS